MRTLLPHRVVLLLLALALAACGGGEPGDRPETAASSPSAELSADELEHGIGPVRSVQTGPIDEALAQRGEQSFTSKCAACHKMDERYVGPALADVLDRRSPAFIMNMMLNPEEMLKRHPEGKAMLAEFLTPMPNQNLTQDEARAILEYLRQQHRSGAATAGP